MLIIFLMVAVVAFIKGLLNNVGSEIDPIRLIRRIQNGLEIPGLKASIIKILQDFKLQVCLVSSLSLSPPRSLSLSPSHTLTYTLPFSLSHHCGGDRILMCVVFFFGVLDFVD